MRIEMKEQADLLQDSVKKLFGKYLVPSISATMVTSVYILADTIMIGKGIGADAIAALNILLPIFSIYFGTGLLCGVGGGVLLSFCMGKGQTEEGNHYFTTALLLNLIMSILYLAAGLLFFKPITVFLGSTSSTEQYIYEYGKVMLIGTPFFLFSSFLQTFIRNDKAPKHAMIAVISGGITNILLDYIFIFIFGWGMKGASLATVIGSGLTCLILIGHFFSKENHLKIRKKGIHIGYVKQIFMNGFSSFLVEMSSGIIIMLFNIQLLRYAGDLGVTVYSIISNTALIVMSMSNGISQAAQPIIAVNHGAGKSERVYGVRRLALFAACIVGIFVTGLGLLWPKLIIEIFLNPTEEILQMAPGAIRLYFWSFTGMAVNNVLSNYFQSVLKPAKALAICLSRGVVLSGIFVTILPMLFGLGITGIWITMPLTELLTFGLAIILCRSNTNAGVFRQ